ncbi:MAG TPA: hypothetical protein VMQ76_08415 [Terracidiphilus sp.]|jgi:hypothetical protein|nr:hypothetical protein [Terracidiphilus sp.]
MPANWKTSLIGAIGALLMAAANYSGEHTWQGYVACLVPVALGLFAKDFDAHSTVAQTQTATIEAHAVDLAAINKQ